MEKSKVVNDAINKIIKLKISLLG